VARSTVERIMQLNGWRGIVKLFGKACGAVDVSGLRGERHCHVNWNVKWCSVFWSCNDGSALGR
jgi:hypothetical protein